MHRQPVGGVALLVPPLFRNRPNLFASLLTGLAIAVASVGFSATTRALIGWNGCVLVFVGLTLRMMLRSDRKSIRRRAEQLDEGQNAILMLTLGAAAASIAAIAGEFASLKGAVGWTQAAQITLVATTILGSWTFVQFVFALHYAHEFHGPDGEPERNRGGLDFPGDDAPDYWDFLYFAFTIGTTAQTSDVGITSKTIRRTVLVHCIAAFLFNTTILALTVNLAAGLL